MGKKKRTIKSSFAFITIIAIILTSAAIFIATFVNLAALITESLEAHVKDVMDSFETEVDWELETCERMSGSLAGNDTLEAAVKANDEEKMRAAIENFKESAGMDSDNVTITDPKGVVLFRLHSDKKGDSLSDNNCIQSALRGEMMTDITTGTTIKLCARSSAPIYDDEDSLIGTVSVIYPFDDNVVVDDVKGDADSEYTIFMGDERVSTTLMENGERALNAKMKSDIAQKVLKNKEEYIGEVELSGKMYMSMYKPLLNQSGEVIGALFTGTYISEIKGQETIAFLVSLIIALVATAAATSFILLYTNRSIAKPIGKLCEETARIACGDLNVDVEQGPNNEIGTLADSLRTTVESVRGYIHDISKNLDLMAEGDMNTRINKVYIGDFSSIKESLLKISDSLNGTLSSINTAAVQVSAGSEQVAIGAQSLSQGATEQASSVEELAASINIISDKIRKNAENAQEANAKTRSSGEEMNQVNQKMLDLVGAMNEIRETSAQTNKIVKTIDDIAFQTNILALNAAVEAARAGSAGRGFAVVADEVRNLAGKSAEAVKNTSALIEETVGAIEKGYRYVEEVADKIVAVAESSNQVAELNEKISVDSKDAAESIKQITSGVEQISNVVQTNSATAEQSAAASEELSGQASMLQDEIAQFKLKNEYGGY